MENKNMNHKQTSVLVTGVGGGGVGEGIVKALKINSEKYRIVVTDEVSMSAALFRADKGYLVPKASDEEYLDKLINICMQEKIIAVIPGSVPELQKISDNREGFEREGIQLIISPKEVIGIGMDKWKTYQFLRSEGFSCPKTYLLRDLDRAISELTFPIFIKPREGYGARHTYVTHDEKELGIVIKYLVGIGVEPLIQQYIEAKECTTGVVVSKLGRILGSISMFRELKLGFSYRTITVDAKEIRETSEELALKLGARGPINVQCFVVDGKPVIFEINPRFSGTTPIRSSVGFKEVDAVLRNFLFGEEIQLKFKKNIVTIRYLDELYLKSSTLSELNQRGYTTERGRRKRYF